jgi:hypothetical protein
MVEFNTHILREGFADGLPVPDSGPPTQERERAVLLVMTAVGF